jgi:segregation and condensation protein A
MQELSVLGRCGLHLRNLCQRASRGAKHLFSGFAQGIRKIHQDYAARPAIARCFDFAGDTRYPSLSEFPPELDPAQMASKPKKQSKASPKAPGTQEALGIEEAVGTSEELAGRSGGYHVTLPTFEGPLDLLLHLIQQHQLDIFDIPISFISAKYVEYIMLMQQLYIDLASEYLVMAATLAHIKSKMLLPKPPVDQDDDAMEELDPRGELVRRLLEYQKYKHAAEQLEQKPVLGRDIFIRGAPAPSVDGQAALAPISVFKLFDAFQRLLSHAKQTAEHLIDVDRISISERILQLTDRLRGKGLVLFVDLFDEDATRPDLIVTFLALLEMTRLRMMQVVQESPLAPILVELTLADEHDEILRKDLGGADPLTEFRRDDIRHGPDSDLARLSTQGDDGSSDPDALEEDKQVRIPFPEMDEQDADELLDFGLDDELAADHPSSR